MKIVIPDENGQVNQHFGKTTVFTFVTVEDDEIVDINNVSIANMQHQHGQLANYIVNEGADTIIAGGMGKGMVDALQGVNLNVITGASGDIKEVVESFIRGELKSKPVTCSHGCGGH